MTTAYPAALDTYADPAGGAVQGSTSPTHAGHHTNHNDAIEAIEAKLGTGTGAPPASAAVLRRTGTGASGWGQIVAGDITTDTITATQIAANAIGSSELADNAVDTAAIVANAVTQVGLTTAVGISTSATTYGDETPAGVTLETTGGDLLVWAALCGNMAAANNAAYMALRLDSGAEVAEVVTVPSNASQFVQTAVWRFAAVSAGSHTVKIRWKVSGSTYSGFSSALLVLEIKR